MRSSDTETPYPLLGPLGLTPTGPTTLTPAYEWGTRGPRHCQFYTLPAHLRRVGHPVPAISTRHISWGPGALSRPRTPSLVDPPQPAAPPQPIVFTLGTDPTQLMQAFFSGLAQFTSQANASGQTTRDPFVSALWEFERHHTPRMMAATYTMPLRSGLRQCKSLSISHVLPRPTWLS
jgi:hypothetical protein